MPKIKIYTAPFCVYCKKAKELFDKNGFNYEEIDIAKNNDVAQEIMKKTSQMGIPVIDINSKIIVGFKENDIKKELNLV